MPSPTLVMYRNCTPFSQQSHLDGQSERNMCLLDWSDTRWESRVSSIETEWTQASNIREALLEVRDKATDPLTKVETQNLTEDFGLHRFLLCTVVWYDILNHLTHVSRGVSMQYPTMQLDVAVELLTNAKTSTSYRDTGFAAIRASAKDTCEEINVEAMLTEKRLSSNKHFACEAPEEPVGEMP